MLHTVPHFCRKKSRRTDRERGRSPFLRWRPIEARAARPHPASAKSYKPPPGLYLRNFLFVRKIHRLFLFPSNPAPHRTANSPRAERRRHATQRNRPPPRGNAPIRPKPSLVVAALCVHLPQIFFLASHPGLGLLGISGRRRPSSCGASSARP
jgi:hypothetical protein